MMQINKPKATDAIGATLCILRVSRIDPASFQKLLSKEDSGKSLIPRFQISYPVRRVLLLGVSVTEGRHPVWWNVPALRPSSAIN